jgi:hypothetical protein
MNRRWWHRVAALSFTAAFLFAGAAEAFGAGDCPHHSRLAVAQTFAAAHQHHGTAHHDSTGSVGDHLGPCTCVGDCSARVAAPAVGIGAALLAPHVNERVVRSPAYATPPQTRTPHRLPFAQGPPALRIA